MNTITNIIAATAKLAAAEDEFESFSEVAAIFLKNAERRAKNEGGWRRAKFHLRLV